MPPVSNKPAAAAVTDQGPLIFNSCPDHVGYLVRLEVSPLLKCHSVKLSGAESSDLFKLEFTFLSLRIILCIPKNSYCYVQTVYIVLYIKNHGEKTSILTLVFLSLLQSVEESEK